LAYDFPLVIDVDGAAPLPSERTKVNDPSVFPKEGVLHGSTHAADHFRAVVDTARASRQAQIYHAGIF
jgi:hypothetical protein